jgi:hypothetical protein
MSLHVKAKAGDRDSRHNAGMEARAEPEERVPVFGSWPRIYAAVEKTGHHRSVADLEVKPKADKNYWPIREYVVWFANR